jgi:hypothetical protein
MELDKLPVVFPASLSLAYIPLTTRKRKETCGTKDGRRGVIDPMT